MEQCCVASGAAIVSSNNMLKLEVEMDYNLRMYQQSITLHVSFSPPACPPAHIPAHVPEYTCSYLNS
jgi:hypothetical protein